MNEWLDEDGYPTRDALDRITTASTQNELVDAVRESWNQRYGSVGEELSESERDVAASMPWVEERLIRLATGGWSGNETVMLRFFANPLHGMAWRMSVAGGLYVLAYREDAR